MARGRVEAECTRSQGQPTHGDLFVSRAAHEPGQPPFWVGKVERYWSPTAADLKIEEKIDVFHRQLLLGEVEACNVPRRAEYKQDDVGGSSTIPTKSAPRRKDQLSTAVNIFQHTHVIVWWWEHFEPAKKPSARLKSGRASKAAQAATSRSVKSTRTRGKASKAKGAAAAAAAAADDDDDDDDEHEASEDSDSDPTTLLTLLRLRRTPRRTCLCNDWANDRAALR